MDFLLQGGSVAVVAIGIAIAGIIFLARRITYPIVKMVDAANRVADGEVDVDVEVTTKDEVRDLAVAFHRMLKSTAEQATLIEGIAKGDLTKDVALRSNKDVVGIALQKMLALNNDVFGRITQSADLVASTANTISSGAQDLAQGSTEQAGVIEELSATVATVAENSKSNADIADEAAKMGNEIRQNAEKGSEQMRHLTEAVNDITAASNAISNVIKVIDDIAFQTNILALNAAVEAARAGEHGKGFAVVADEVRNLAGKSAEAAKDTSGMISNTIAKAKQGAEIADETAKSLFDIVTGINRSSELVNEIASSASISADAITQVNVGIDQVAQVIQTNSATAEESAASSEEMQSQSELLKGLVAQFRIKAQSNGGGNLIMLNQYN
jgi:methyl-accepting chemotaxis protein